MLSPTPNHDGDARCWATVAAWFVAAGAAFVILGVIASRWDDLQIGQPLYDYQQKIKWAAAAGFAFGV